MRGYGAPWSPDRTSREKAERVMEAITSEIDRELIYRWMNGGPITPGEEQRVALEILPLIRKTVR